MLVASKEIYRGAQQRVYIDCRLTYEGFNKVGTTEQKKNIEHVKNKAEDYYWEADNLQEDMAIGEFMICIDEDDSNSDDEGNVTDDSFSSESSDDD